MAKILFFENGQDAQTVTRRVVEVDVLAARLQALRVEWETAAADAAAVTIPLALALVDVAELIGLDETEARRVLGDKLYNLAG